MRKMRFKSKSYIDHSAFFVCREIDCKEESTRIWAGKETPVVDLCDQHYKEAKEEVSL